MYRSSIIEEKGMGKTESVRPIAPPPSPSGKKKECSNCGSRSFENNICVYCKQ